MTIVKKAELSGLPGPAHLVELKDEIALSEKQVIEIGKIYQDMKTRAIAAGERFIAAESALSEAFGTPGLSQTHLRQLIEDAATARAELRFIHLSQHLNTPNLLTKAQIQKYNILRGYAADPCASVPEGHNAEMWRKHNHCD